MARIKRGQGPNVQVDKNLKVETLLELPLKNSFASTDEAGSIALKTNNKIAYKDNNGNIVELQSESIPLIFASGLNEKDGLVKLGLDPTTIGTTNKGILTEDLYLVAGDLLVDYTAFVLGTSGMQLAAKLDGKESNIRLTPSFVILDSTNSQLYLSDNSAALKLIGSGLTLTNGTDSHYFSDDFAKGLTYRNDYGAKGTLDDRWIPDYGAVKALVATKGTVKSVNGVQPNPTTGNVQLPPVVTIVPSLYEVTQGGTNNTTPDAIQFTGTRTLNVATESGAAYYTGGYFTLTKYASSVQGMRLLLGTTDAKLGFDDTKILKVNKDETSLLPFIQSNGRVSGVTAINGDEFITKAYADATYTSDGGVETPDATTLIKGKLRLSGDLGGTADAPTVPGLALKAPLASPAFTGTVTGITASMVGLGNVNNTPDLAKPISTATQAALDAKASNTDLALKAPLASPAFTGTVTGITASMVGLNNVNNTSDLAKPISTATQNALDLKQQVINFSTTGTGAATFDGVNLNIPTPSEGGSTPTLQEVATVGNTITGSPPGGLSTVTTLTGDTIDMISETNERATLHPGTLVMFGIAGGSVTLNDDRLAIAKEDGSGVTLDLNGINWRQATTGSFNLVLPELNNSHTATFQDASGTVAYLTDIAVNVGSGLKEVVGVISLGIKDPEFEPNMTKPGALTEALVLYREVGGTSARMNIFDSTSEISASNAIHRTSFTAESGNDTPNLSMLLQNNSDAKKSGLMYLGMEGLNSMRMSMEVGIANGDTTAPMQSILISTNFATPADSYMKIIDQGSKRGLQYDADYSATFEERSLVDRAYVDKKIGNEGDTYGNKTQNIVTLSEAEFNAIGTPNVNTLYMVTA